MAESDLPTQADLELVEQICRRGPGWELFAEDFDALRRVLAAAHAHMEIQKAIDGTLDLPELTPEDPTVRPTESGSITGEQLDRLEAMRRCVVADGSLDMQRPLVAEYIHTLFNAAESLIAAARRAGEHHPGYEIAVEWRDKFKVAEAEAASWKAKAEEAAETLHFATDQSAALNRVRELEAERDKERAARVESERKVADVEAFMEKIRQECRGKNPEGATLLDFMSVWNEQYKEAVERERQRADAAVALVRRLRDMLGILNACETTESIFGRMDRARAAAEAWLKK